ncbi:LCP family protein [Paenibacillus sp. 481]|uniref:LCP family protein n=1 Tax=Paenibacillus sp. 481 TaxID=2835869 RepID=UPI001E34F96A|nr:LCP family protein [Paenibacillus sp. 481]UHA72496.1 LCP family protein [Paenibacillus sp. 481]
MEQQDATSLTSVHPKKKNYYRIFAYVALAFVLIGSIAFVYRKELGLVLFDLFVAKPVKEVMNDSYVAVGTEVYSPPPSTTTSYDPFSILLLGVDPRGNERGRSDSIIFTVIRPDDNKLLLVSIPRDSYVDIIGKDKKTKINAAHSYGGPKMSIDTVEHLLKNKINYYATVNFNGLKDFVNALGGVKLPITKLIENKHPYHDKLRIEPNKPIYDGQEALSYVRYREDSDENRTMRQRIFLNSVMDELLTFKNLSNIPALLKIGGANFTTNMSSDFIVSVAKDFYMKNSLPTISSYMLHGTGVRTDAWYYEIDADDLEYTQKLIANWLDPNMVASQLIDPALGNNKDKDRGRDKDSRPM